MANTSATTFEKSLIEEIFKAGFSFATNVQLL
jgi:hypothetical protein